MKTLFTFIITLCIVGVTSGEDKLSYNQHIRPILSDNCFYCHGFDAENRKADLRLDTFAGATADLGGYRAVDLQAPGESELLLRILSDDPDEVMPPPETEQHITDAQRDLIRRWIEQGAEYEEHWSWLPLKRPPTPGGEPKNKAATIDAFLASEWQQQGVAPVKAASPRQRLRRLSYDLRGIPPTHAEVEAYEKSPNDETFLAFRDRWMSELTYAEHQAVRWLDLVRWADTSGFVSDEPIASGAYRSWIIRSLVQNQPFDQFSIEQLAGDLLPNPSDDQLVASGYNRIVNTNCEAGAIETEQIYKLKGEHVRALGTVWMGLTTGCAECHDHKFDPISAKDYYSLAAFFDDLVEAGVYTPGDRREPLHYVHSRAADGQKDRELAGKIESLKIQLAAAPTDGMAEWEAQMRKKLSDTKTRQDFSWVPASLPAPRVLEGNYTKGADFRETKTQPNQLARHHSAEMMTGYLETNKYKTDEALDHWYAMVWLDPANPPNMVGLQISHGDYGRLGWRAANYETYIWGEDTSGILKKEQPWSTPERVKRLGDLPEASGWVRLEIPLKEGLKPERGQNFEATGMAWLQVGGTVRWGESGIHLRTDKTTELTLGETAIRKWWHTPKNRNVYQSRLSRVAAAVRKTSKDRDAVHGVLADLAFRESSQSEVMAALRQLESELYTLRARADAVLVSKASPDRKVTRILNRGDFNDTTGPVVSPGVPGFLGSLPKERESSRLDLAKWLFAEGSPLIARVYVNRLWHQFYGRGLSETLEDSGTQGDWPSHLELLDWLAVEFRDSGWDRDHMVRVLTSTKAYQLSSRPTADLRHRDPDNRWHTHQSHHRLTAESIRDSALLAAGLLKLTDAVPKSSFFPYQPDVYWKSSDKVMWGSRHLDWNTETDQRQYQRTVYTFWKRQNIHPSLLTFDAPTRQECTAKRNVTNTPGQALALLNDPTFVEAARVLASRIATEGTDLTKIEKLYTHVLQRKPTDAEVAVLTQLLQKQRGYYRSHAEQAGKLLAIGNTPPLSGIDSTELAAWTVVARAMLNLHEFINRS